MGDRQHADFPSEEISSRSDFTLLSCGEEPCPLSPHRGFLIPHPSPFSIQYIFKFITALRMLLRLEKKGEKVYKSYLTGISSEKSPFGRKSQF
jgi:hypothetical protein